MKKNKKHIKKSILCTAVTLALITSMSGCLGGNDTIGGLELDHTGYTFDEINAMAVSNSNLDEVTDEDLTEEALHAYNQMLGYVENVLGFEYKVYYYFHVDYGNSGRGGYVMSIVLAEDVESVEAEVDNYRKNSDERTILLSTDEDGNNLSSAVVPYLMGNKWCEDVYNSISEILPGAHTNMRYVGLYEIIPEVASENYTDFYDYYYYYDVETFNSDEYFRFDNLINVILPPDTPESEAETIYNEILPTLKQYCVTQVSLVFPTDEESFEKIISEEGITDNYYVADPEDGINSIEWFDVKEKY